MTAYQQFQKQNINIELLGFLSSDNQSGYFCTPKGAEIIGWAGVDGIHFCFIPGYGETVFAVSPMNLQGDYVFPLAHNFSDFLSLLMACGDTAALEQAHCWNQAEFDAFLTENPLTAEQSAVIKCLSERLPLKAMAHPFAYMKQVQADFDSSKLVFPEIGESPAQSKPESSQWNVYFEGNFWGHPPRERAGTEIPTQVWFRWNEKDWYIPAVYCCSKGLVIDFCLQAPIEQIRQFLDKWELSPENNGAEFTNEQRLHAEVENPLHIDIAPEIVLNGKTISTAHGSGFHWQPDFPEENCEEAEATLAHYELSTDCGWGIWRAAFPWDTKRKPKISSLQVNMIHHRANIIGSQFSVTAPGECISFLHPVTNTTHTLTVQEYEPCEIPAERFVNEEYIFPTHSTAMSYTLSPDLPDLSFSIRDCCEGDHPYKKHSDPTGAHSVACAFGIIHSSYSTATPFGGDNQGKLCSVCSALHFQPVGKVTWRMLFHEKPCEDLMVTLL